MMKIINIQHHRNTEVLTQNYIHLMQFNFAIPFLGCAFISLAFYKERLITKPAVLCLRVILALCFTRNRNKIT